MVQSPRDRRQGEFKGSLQRLNAKDAGDIYRLFDVIDPEEMTALGVDRSLGIANRDGYAHVGSIGLRPVGLQNGCSAQPL